MIIEINSSEGDVRLRTFKDDAEYLKTVNKELEDCSPPEFIKLGKDSQGMSGSFNLAAIEGTLVIRGEVVEPKPKEVVKTWTL